MEFAFDGDVSAPESLPVSFLDEDSDWFLEADAEE